MKSWRRLLHWLRARREDADLRAELEFHRAEVQRDFEARGLDPATAVMESRRRMGNVALARDDARDVWMLRALDLTWRDLRYGARALRRERAFALTAILTLAIGAATAITVFSVADAELWKPLPFDRPDRLVVAYASAPGAHAMTESLSGAEFLDWAAAASAFSDCAAYGVETRRSLQLDTATSVVAADVTWNLFQTLGRRPVAGRTFVESDGATGAIVLTDRAWRRLFNADPAVTGRTVAVDGRPLRVVGIVAAVDVDGPDADVYRAIDASTADFHDRRAQTLTNVVGRLRPGATIEEARAELQAVAARIARDYPEPRAGHVAHVEPYREYYGLFNPRPLYFFLAASLLVLVLACINVAGLLLARALKRRSEFAIRGALGGGAAALLRQLVTEGLCLAMPACLCALLLARWALGVLTTEVPPDYLSRSSALAIDWRVGGFALLVSAVTAAVFGLAPALTARRVDLNVTLGNGGRTTGGTPAQSRARVVLLTAQLALTLVLLTAAGLFVRSYAALTHVPVGYEAEGRVSIRASLSGPRYESDSQMRDYATELIARATAVPGVQQAVVATSSPLTSGPVVRFVAAGRPRPPAGDESRAIIRATTPGYFGLLGIPLSQGRDFTSTDAPTAPRVAVVNEVLARRLFRGENPIGRTLTLLPGPRVPWTRRPGNLTIVGVSASTKEVGLNEVEFEDIYVPFAQMPAPWVELLARSAVPVSAIAAPLREAAARLDPEVPVTGVSPLVRRVGDALREDRFHLLLISSFALVAVLLAAMGIYGAVAYAAEQRRREFGVRLALGASGVSIVLTALRQSLWVASAGAVVGLAATLLAVKLIGSALYLVPGDAGHEGLLFGVRGTDPYALGGALAVLLSVTLLASAAPARRCARIDPVTSLREE